MQPAGHESERQRVCCREAQSRRAGLRNGSRLAVEEINAAGKQELLAKIDYEKWVHTPGFLPVEPDFSTNLAKEAKELCNEILDVNENNVAEEITLLNRKERYNNSTLHDLPFWRRTEKAF